MFSAQLNCTRFMVRFLLVICVGFFIASCDENDRPTPIQDIPFHIQFMINEGSPATRDTVLRISITGEHIEQMKLSVNPDLEGAEWVEYDTLTIIHAPREEGIFTIYGQLASPSGGATEILYDNIELDFTAQISELQVYSSSDTLIPGGVIEFILVSGESGRAEVGVGSFLKTYPLYDTGNGIYTRQLVLPRIMPADTVQITGRFTDAVGNSAEEVTFNRNFFLQGEPLVPVLISRIEFVVPSKDQVVHHNGFCYVSSLGQINIINAIDPNRLYYVGEMRTSSWAHGLFMEGDVLYAVDNADHVMIFDVRVPDRPVRLSNIKIWGFATDVEVHNNFAFVSATLTGIHVIDISNKEVPTVKTRLAVTCNAEAICRNNETLFVGGGTVISIVDISTPEDPQILSELHGLDGDVLEVMYYEGNLFIATHDRGVLRVDVDDLENPVFKGEYPHLKKSSGFALQTPYLFVSRKDTLSIVNITNLDDLPVIAEISDVNLSNGLSINNNFLYAVEQDGLAVIELIRAD